MKNIERVAEFTPDTLAALEHLAKITGAESVSHLIQEGLRVLEWVVYHQANGERVVAIKQDGDMEELAPFIESSKEEARKYFTQPV